MSTPSLALSATATGSLLWAPVRGASMTPLLRPGDQVLIDLSRPWRCGDVVVIGSQRGLVVHRIVALAGANVITKGDAVEHCDQGVNSAAIVGVVIRVRRRRWWGRWQEQEV